MREEHGSVVAEALWENQNVRGTSQIYRPDNDVGKRRKSGDTVFSTDRRGHRCAAT